MVSIFNVKKKSFSHQGLLRPLPAAWEGTGDDVLVVYQTERHEETSQSHLDSQKNGNLKFSLQMASPGITAFE